MSNFSQAWKAFWTVLKGKPYTPQLEESTDGEDTLKLSNDRRPESVREAFENGAVYSLTLLQREGRLIDFIKEDISGFDDAQVGAAVRQIHAGTRKVLEENFSLEPIFPTTEGEEVVVRENYDPSETTLVGDHPEVGPYSGVLQHKGWIAGKVELPTRVGNINQKVVQQAEVSF